MIYSYSRRFPAVATSIRRARADVANYARACGFGEAGVSDIQAAAGEALANVVAHRPESAGYFSVACDFNAGEIRVRIDLDGRAGDAVSGGRTPSALARGLGMTIMHALMDNVYAGASGSIVMVKSRGVATLGVANRRGAADAVSVARAMPIPECSG